MKTFLILWAISTLTALGQQPNDQCQIYEMIDQDPAPMEIKAKKITYIARQGWAVVGYDLMCSRKMTHEECRDWCDKRPKCVQYDIQPKINFCCPGYRTKPLTKYINESFSYEKQIYPGRSYPFYSHPKDKGLKELKSPDCSPTQIKSFWKSAEKNKQFCQYQSKFTATILECQRLCEQKKDCFGFYHEVDKCSFISSSYMTAQNTVESADLYVRQCLTITEIEQDFEEIIKNPSEQRLQKNLELIKLYFEQLSQNPDKHFKQIKVKAEASEVIYNDYRGLIITCVIFVILIFVVNLGKVHHEIENKCVFIILLLLSLPVMITTLVQVTKGLGEIYKDS